MQLSKCPVLAGEMQKTNPSLLKNFQEKKHGDIILVKKNGQMR